MTEAMQAEWIRYVESLEGQYALKTWDGDTRNQCWAFHLWMKAQAIKPKAPAPWRKERTMRSALNGKCGACGSRKARCRSDYPHRMGLVCPNEGCRLSGNIVWEPETTGVAVQSPTPPVPLGVLQFVTERLERGEMINPESAQYLADWLKTIKQDPPLTAGPTDVWQQVQIDAAKWRAQELQKELGWDQPEAPEITP